jgi:UDP-glucuronate 4-epimerase
LQEGHEVVGIDSFSPYYPPILKRARHEILKSYSGFREKESDLCDLKNIEEVFQTYNPEFVCHLAAQPGVRYSLINPWSYQKSNLEAFVNILELARKYKVKRIIYASSSSVYGNVKEVPYQEDQAVDTPISLYAATKRANELMAYTYTHLYGLQTIGLRFFTVYGPWGRPDMAIWRFTDAIACGEPIDVFNFGDTARDFTYIDDIVAGIKAALAIANLEQYEIINLGNHRPENVRKLIGLLEKALGHSANIRFVPRQPGDMITTFANIDKARQKLGYNPRTLLEEGIPQFVSWFQQHRELVSEVKRIGCLG